MISKSRPPAPTNVPTWEALRRLTNARIALGRTGDSLPTAPLLAFDLAHAQARDAVHQPLDAVPLGDALRLAGFSTLSVESAAPDRTHYLRRPDWGRQLSERSIATLSAARQCLPADTVFDVVFVVADGLSAHAASRHALPLLEATRRRLQGWHIGPIVIATQARVALGDGIGALLGATFVVMLLGERPGLSSPDSLGVYLTYAPRIGITDAQRNCISNVRPEGLSYELAAFKLEYLLNAARRRKMTGIQLKDDSDHLLAQRLAPTVEGGTSDGVAIANDPDSRRGG